MIEGRSTGEATVWDLGRRTKVGGWSIADGRLTTAAGGALLAVVEDRVLVARIDGAAPVSLVSLVARERPSEDTASARTGLAFRDDGGYAGGPTARHCLPALPSPNRVTTLLSEVFR